MSYGQRLRLMESYKENDNGTKERKEVKEAIRQSKEAVRQRSNFQRIKRSITGASAKDIEEDLTND